MANLIIVVDPDYGERLETAPLDAPVWVVATQTNRNACESLWKRYPHSDHREKGAVTCYETTNPEDRLGSLLGILPDLETHHGEMTGAELELPKGFIIKVIGLAITDHVTDALEESGFTSFIEMPEGFQVSK